MNSHAGGAPAWLFSFVDLAFLLLIAMTQLAKGSDPIELGEIIVPRLDAEAVAELPSAANDSWQLRVHPPTEGHAAPFELVSTHESTDAAARDARFESAALRDRLAALKATGKAKPLLAPHEDSRSQDLLDAVALLEEQWPSRRRAMVELLQIGP